MKFKESILIFFIVLFCVSAGSARAGTKNLKMKQPGNVSASYNLDKGSLSLPSQRNLTKRDFRIAPKLSYSSISQIEIKSDLLAALEMANRLDKKADRLLKIITMGPIERWFEGVNEARLEGEYAEDLVQHLKVMTVLFRNHRKFGPFKNYMEFEFHNILAKSDYLLSLVISRYSVEKSMQHLNFADRFNSVVAEYNTERLGYDQKVIPPVAFKN